MRNAIFATVIVSLSSVLGCSSEPADLGDDKTGENLSDYAASWDGYAEAYEFESGSDRLRIVLDAGGQGSVEFGDEPALPAAIDPDQAYPPSLDVTPFISRLGASIWGGFQYAVHESTVAGRRLRFSVDLRELYVQWCRLQTSFLVSSPDAPQYQCMPPIVAGGGVGSCLDAPDECCSFDSMGQATRYDCNKRALCQGPICDCTASGCDVVPSAPGSESSMVLLDAALEEQATQLVGTLRIGDRRINVRLTRH